MLCCRFLCPQTSGPRSVDLLLEMGGRKVDVQLSVDGATLRTAVLEPYDSAAAAEAAFDRVCAAMEADGYRRRQ